ncbi:Malate/L-lactate dehydrogenase [Podospora conica]|nr:Malate/L-lactate dehydrogenase [Schizothecium conicum]
MADPQTPVLIRHQDAELFTTTLLLAAGVPRPAAAITASALVEADLRGVESHGINRLPSYLARIRAGVLDPAAEPTLTQITPAVAQIDAHNTLAFPPCALAIDTAVALASTSGIALVSVKNSNHFGMAAWLVRRALSSGPYLVQIFTNASPALAPWGGRAPLLGVNPIAVGAPGRPRPFILDMAPSVAARGWIHRALRRGEGIPGGWALDERGGGTEDPAEALRGGATMVPIGGPKGVGLAVVGEVMGGVMSGTGGFAGGVRGPGDLRGEAGVGRMYCRISCCPGPEALGGRWTAVSVPWCFPELVPMLTWAFFADLVVVMRADLFVSAEEFRERMGVLWERVVGAERREGVDRIWFPGEKEQVCEDERREKGIPYVRGEVDTLNAEADRLSVERLREMDEQVVTEE